ncbi:MAG: hypothetical protein ACJA1H_001604, partial [Glaciecola sp.]
VYLVSCDIKRMKNLDRTLRYHNVTKNGIGLAQSN